MSTKQAPSLQVEHPFEGCTVLTLHRPQASNALTLALRRDLTAKVQELGADKATRVLVITGAGKAFCAGLDLQELGASDKGTAALVAGPTLDPVAALRAFPGPVIGAINGAAVTGGFELALACDVLLASTLARFADTHARVGVVPGWGLSQVLPRVIGPYRAKELSLTGNFLSAAKAEQWGLVNRVVEPEHLMEQALQLARDMLSSLPDMLPIYKRLIDDGWGRSLDAGLRLERIRSRAWARTLAGSDIADRRDAVRARGRQQTLPTR